MIMQFLKSVFWLISLGIFGGIFYYNYIALHKQRTIKGLNSLGIWLITNTSLVTVLVIAITAQIKI